MIKSFGHIAHIYLFIYLFIYLLVKFSQQYNKLYYLLVTLPLPPPKKIEIFFTRLMSSALAGAPMYLCTVLCVPTVARSRTVPRRLLLITDLCSAAGCWGLILGERASV